MFFLGGVRVLEANSFLTMLCVCVLGLVQRMHTDRSLFDKFYKHYFNNFSPTPACDKYCYARW